MRKLIVLLFWCIAAYAIETDFDCIVVGTSPMPMLEAIYQRGLGHRVLIVEQAAECGGAWKSITICGISNVDLGCHDFRHDSKVRQFLEEYAGCNMVTPCSPPEQHPNKRPHLPDNFYPSGGCYELIHNLELLIHHLGIALLFNAKLESFFIDASREIAEVKINGMRYTTKKLMVTPHTELNLETSPSKIHVYPHIYMLISDPTQPRFSYKGLVGNGASRAMNITPFVKELEGTGMQLISIQVRNEQFLDTAEKQLDDMKKQNLVDPNAQIITTENYTYKQTLLDQTAIQKLDPTGHKIIEFLNTGSITNLGHHIDKWKGAMKPWNEVMEKKAPAQAA